MRRTLAAVLLLAATTVPAATAAAADPIYLDPAQPVAARVADLLGRMTLDEKIGQMTQAERDAVSDGRHHHLPARLAAVRRRLGALAQQRRRRGPTCTTASSARALATPLGIPMIYGVDAVHGHNNVRRRDDLPAQHRPRRDPRSGAGAADRPGHRRGGLGHRHRLELRAVPVRRPQRPVGPHLRVVRREAGDRRRRWPRWSPACRAPARRTRLGAGHRQALRRRRRHDRRRRPGRHAGQRGRAAGDPPAAVPRGDRRAASAR